MPSRFSSHRDLSPVAPSAPSPTSRRALLGGFVIAPIALPVLASPGAVRALSAGSLPGVPVVLRRTRAGLLYHTGIVIQLGLSAHLIDVGFDDAWCARHLGLHLDRSLALANATGLDLDAPPIAALAGFLSPYGQWRHADVGKPPDYPFAPGEMRVLTRALLDHVRAVTGHGFPARGRRQRGRG
ncbi:MAG: hypothetical protein P8Y48_18755 [Novosphingobium sp.]